MIRVLLDTILQAVVYGPVLFVHHIAPHAVPPLTALFALLPITFLEAFANPPARWYTPIVQHAPLLFAAPVTPDTASMELALVALQYVVTVN